MLSEDFYALTFMSYKKENVKLYKLTSKQQARYFQSCLWVFGVQLILLYLICDEMLFQPIKDGRLTFHVPDVSTLFGQFFACVLLHMELVGEVRQGIHMIRYVTNNPDKFTKPSVAILVGCMQALGGFWAEFVNIVVLAQRHNVQHCLQDFIAFELLTNVDNIYCETLPNFHLKESLKEELHL